MPNTYAPPPGSAPMPQPVIQAPPLFNQQSQSFVPSQSMSMPFNKSQPHAEFAAPVPPTIQYQQQPPKPHFAVSSSGIGKPNLSTKTAEFTPKH